ncbi:MAG TPA: nucleotidyltransferase family protein [Anaeromyxobacteraceae bacterium]|nr:nucleotidyltransferase family protein [Anaeromyxobacteraceae bacterium]
MHGAGEALRDVAAAMPGDPVALRAACGRVADWDSLAAGAERQGLAGILWRDLERAGVSPPPGAARRLADFVTLQRLRQPRLDADLDRALLALGSAGVPCAVLKGPPLGERLYGEAALRPSLDLDLLVAPADLDRAVAALAAAGWRAQGGPTARWQRRHHHHLLLEQPAVTGVELHFRAVTGFGGALPAEDLLARAAPGELRGRPVRRLAAEDEVLHLAVHAAGHGMGRLLWLVDIKAFLARHPGLDWDAVRQRARARGLGRAAAWAFSAVADLGAPVPPAARALSPGRRRAAERAARIATRAERPWSTAASLVLNAILADGPLTAARSLAVNLARVARRRAARALGRGVPEEWSA